MGGSNVWQAFPNDLICLCFVRINTVCTFNDGETVDEMHDIAASGIKISDGLVCSCMTT